MKLNITITLALFAVLWLGCEPEMRRYKKSDIQLMEPGNYAIIKNKVKAAHLICVDPEGCGVPNDTIMSTYYDEAGRLVKMRNYATGTVELVAYDDNSNWEVKRTKESNNRVFDIAYVVNDSARTLTEVVTDGADTIGMVIYSFDEEGRVFQFGPDLAGGVHHITYNQDGMVNKEVLDYERSEPGQIDRMEDVVYYREGRLDSIVRNFYDVNGVEAMPTLYIRCRYDGLMERVDGAKKYMFNYEFY